MVEYFDIGLWPVLHFFFKFVETFYFIVPVEKVHSFEGDNFIIFVNDMHTRLLNGPNVKIIGIYKLHDYNSK